MIKRVVCLTLLIGLLMSLLSLSVQARPAAAPVTVIDDHHTTLTLPAPAQRIISLAPNVTEILFSLGLGNRVLGVSSYSTYPKAATRLPIIIDNGVPSIEKIVAMQPDLLISADIVPEATVVKLRSLHLNVLQTNPHDIPGILHDIQLVGDAAGIHAAAQHLVTGLSNRISVVESRIRLAGSRPTVFYELDKTLYTVGHGSYMDTLITMAGGKNVAGGIMVSYPQLSAEKVLVANPQYIILGDALYGQSPATVAARPGWSAISAVRQHHVYAFNDDLASRPGPRIVDGLEVLARLLHPEIVR